MKRCLVYTVFSALVLIPSLSFAGNPDRQGEVGGYELLLNPWARNAGLHAMSTSMAYGVEAMQINIAGLSRLGQNEFVIAHTRLFEGTGITLNSLGYAQKMGEAGAFGLCLTAMDFGDIEVTTTGATLIFESVYYSPSA